jgi:flagellin-specific chaperone FliS
MVTTPRPQTGGQHNASFGYRQQQIMTASPDHLILMLYDLALTACNQKDSVRLGRVLAELIDSLDFTYEDVSTGFFRLYEYCLNLNREKQFDAVARIIKELRDSWAKATQTQFRKVAT